MSKDKNSSADQGETEAPVEGPLPGKSPEKRRPISAGQFSRRMAGLDIAFVGLVLVFAFLLGSFAAGNSDIWMHLAAGRLIAQGQYEFGKDPFAFTSSDGAWIWINHSWLFDLVLYKISEIFGGVESARGGTALVIFKAILVVGVAVVLLCLRRPGQPFWIPGICTTLAVLAISSRLLLQPVCISFFFLAVTLYLIQGFKKSNGDANSRDGGRKAGIIGIRQLIFLPLLFALWANLDEWFILGPIALGLYLAGEWMQLALTSGYPGALAPYPRDLRWLSLALLLGVAACLATPFHIHGFTLPTELWVWFTGGVFRKDNLFSGILLSGIAMNKFWETTSGFNSPGVAFFLLIVIGLASFVLNRGNLRLGRLFVWGIFCVFSLGLGRLGPFFAVVSGALASLNLQEFSEQPWGAKIMTDSRWRQWLVGGRVLSLIGVGALIVLAWPGWLHLNADDPRRSRHVDWEVRVDPSLKNAALKLCQLRENNILRETDHGFNFGLEAASYCAWFCPQEKGFFDTRLPLFQNAAISYLDIHKAFFPRQDELEEPVPSWQELFRDQRHSINHVIISSVQREAFKYPQRFWADPDQWVMLFADGRTFIFGWKDPDNPEKGKVFAGQEIRFPEMAFAPGLPDEKKVPDLIPDPPRPKVWLESFLRPPPLPLLAVEEAFLYHNYLERTERNLQGKARKAIAWYQPIRTISWWANPAVSPWTGGGWLVAGFSGKMMIFDADSRIVYNYFSHPADALTSSTLLLSVRAARRAIAGGTQDWQAYSALGGSYQKLFYSLENRWTGGGSRLLQQLRQIQMITALKDALILTPNEATLHQMLGQIYFSDMNVETFFGGNSRDGKPTPFLDLALEHWQQFLTILKAAKPLSGKNAEDFQRQLKKDEEFVNQLKMEIDRLRDRWVVEGANKPPEEKAQRALSQGLVKEALDQLRKVDPLQLGNEGNYLKNLLLICTGNGREVQASQERIVDSLHAVFLGAALGDYAVADQYLEAMFHKSKRDSMFRFLDQLRYQTFANTSPQMLFEIIHGPARPLDWAEYLVLRGLLALEKGDTESAAEYFRGSLKISKRPREEEMYLVPLGAGSPLEAGTLQIGAVYQITQPFRTFPMQHLAARYLQFLRAAGHRP